MARRVLPKRRVVALSRALWPDYRATIRTYLSALEAIELVEIPFDDATGAIDLAALEAIADDGLLCTVPGYPERFWRDRAARADRRTSRIGRRARDLGDRGGPRARVC